MHVNLYRRYLALKPKSCHGDRFVFAGGPEIVVMTNSGATNDDNLVNVGIMKTLRFQYKTVYATLSVPTHSMLSFLSMFYTGWPHESGNYPIVVYECLLARLHYMTPQGPGACIIAQSTAL